jgi:5'-deoxynucleotidase YfbR-like HD superfamily hydrolase
MNSNNKLIQRFMSGLVKRYHTQPTIGEQTVAHHSWGVAMLYDMICPNPTYEGLRECILHDSAELYIGDVPFQTKQAYKSVDSMYKELEDFVRKEVDIPDDPKDPYVKVCDMLELCMFAYYQMTLGNANYKIVFDRGLDYINKMDVVKENLKTRSMIAQMMEDMNYE